MGAYPYKITSLAEVTTICIKLRKKNTPNVATIGDAYHYSQ